jgi:site-specific recombinase XerD
MKILPVPEVGRLLSAVNLRDPFGVRDYNMVQLALHTGLRVSELVSLDVRHVAHKGQPREMLYLSPALAKGGRERTIPLNTTAQASVQALLDFNKARGFSVEPEAPLFVTRKHQRVSVRLVQRLVESLRERGGLSIPATPHTMRHTFASNVASSVGNLRIVQKLLGHKRLSTVEIYTHPTPDQLRAAVETIVPGGAA